jgi:hypothetical protein
LDARFVILREAKELLFAASIHKEILRFAQDENQAQDDNQDDDFFKKANYFAYVIR